MTVLTLFTEDARGMFRPTDLAPAAEAAVRSLSTVQSNRLLILRLLVEHEWLTMFCPFVLLGFDARFKQTAIGPRFKGLRQQGLIELVESRSPRAGAESSARVSCFVVTAAGRNYLTERSAP